MDEQVIDAMVEAAAQARAHAYSPYSRHLVGASVLGEDGVIYAGCNVEMVSLQTSMHAERLAVGIMAAAGVRRLTAVCVVGPYSGIPCAECRQVIQEFAAMDPGVCIISAPTDGPRELLRLGDIHPFPYAPETKGIDPKDF